MDIEITDRMEIEATMRAYSASVDKREPERLALDVFAADARSDMGYGVWEGGERIAAEMAAVVARFERSAHLLANFAIDVDGDLARCTAYVTAWHWAPAAGRPAERPADFATIGVYIDRLRREPQGWRVIEHRFRRLGPSAIGVGELPGYIRPTS